MCGLVDAWRHWFAGESVTKEELWGLSVLWWGRIGMGLEFLGALTIIAEIIGPARLRPFGETLRGHQAIQKAFRFSLRTLRWGWLQLVAFVLSPEESKRGQRAFDQAWRMGAAKVHVFLWALLLAPTAYFLYHPHGWQWLIALGVALLVAMFLAIPVTVVVVVLPTVLAVLLDLIVIQPVARFLEFEALATLIKIGAAILLVVGFHFDLLAS